MNPSTEPLIVREITKRFGSTVALEDIDLELPAGKLVCFLGPSGCGKTTLLRIIAGLEQPTRGQVFLGERELTELPVHRRNVGMVFQSFALFPHLSVAENISYGLRIRGSHRRQRLGRAEELLELVRLSGLGDRHVSQLSGGQRQRVAMARALALEPSLFLLDEPLSALDAKLRGAMQVELRQLQQKLGITTIIVTHDQEEAMTMADVVVVMGDNRVQQTGAPLDVYRRPSNRFVADFLGSNNFLPARVVSGSEVEVVGQRLDLKGTVAAATLRSLEPGDAVTVSIRPEDVRLRTDSPGSTGSLAGRVVFVRDLGSLVETFVHVQGIELIVVGAPRLEPGAEVWLELPANECVVLSE